MTDYLLYVAYGSNLLRERLMVYIKGGVFMGREYVGSEDRSEPQDFGWVRVPYRLYFANSSPRWDNKGVAFLSIVKETNPDLFAIVRLWKISAKQFEDIQEQEGSWYNEILSLGQIEDIQIKTLTGNFENCKNEPSEKYLSIVKAGLKETTGWDDEKIEFYLKNFL